MRIDGYSPAFVPNRTTRPDASAYTDAVLRQDEVRTRQPDNPSDVLRTDSHQAVRQVPTQTEYERYQERTAALAKQLTSYQSNKAMTSYSMTASFTDNSSDNATQVLGLDLYA